MLAQLYKTRKFLKTWNPSQNGNIECKLNEAGGNRGKRVGKMNLEEVQLRFGREIKKVIIKNSEKLTTEEELGKKVYDWKN